MRFPDFFILGAPKCGTTTLHSALRGHSSLHLPENKEPGILSHDVEDLTWHRYSIRSLQEYCSLFDAASNVQLTGEATPRTLYSVSALDTIQKYQPYAKFIVILRDPIDLAFSYHGQKVKEGLEREANFEAAWLRSVEPNSAMPLSDEPYLDGQINYAFWARFGEHIRRWRNYFDETQLIIFLLSDLQNDMRAVYKTTLEFLGVDDDGRSDFYQLNERVEIKNVALNRAAIQFQYRLRPFLDPIRRARGGKSFGALKALNRLNTKKPLAKIGVSSEMRGTMMKAIEDDLRVAEAVVGRRIRRKESTTRD